MKLNNSKVVAEFIGIAAIVASLRFVGLQIRQEDEIARLEYFSRYDEQVRQLNGLMLNYADIWTKGCLGSELSEADRLIFQKIYEGYVYTTYILWVSQQMTKTSGNDGQFLIDAFTANLHRFPGFQEAELSRGAWARQGRRYNDDYIAAFADAVNKRSAELEESEPNPDWDVKHCGSL